MRVIGQSRRELFETVERAALQPLPAEAFEMESWKPARVSPDYHVAFDGHFYSVPHRLIAEVVEIRATASVVEIFHENMRVASHLRASAPGRHTTLADHMPSHHRTYAAWTPERVSRWAATIGPHVQKLTEQVTASRRHPEHPQLLLAYRDDDEAPSHDIEPWTLRR